MNLQQSPGEPWWPCVPSLRPARQQRQQYVCALLRVQLSLRRGAARCCAVPELLEPNMPICRNPGCPDPHCVCGRGRGRVQDAGMCQMRGCARCGGVRVCKMRDSLPPRSQLFHRSYSNKLIINIPYSNKHTSNPGHRSHRYPNPRACAVAKHGFLIDSTPSLLHLYRTKLSRRVSRRVSTRRVLSCALFLFAVCRRGRACCPSVLQIHDAAHGERSSCCKLDVTGH